jgi:hypothetical protein
VRSLELKLKRNLTTGMFNFVVKDPIRTALGGRFGSDGHTTRMRPSVLETFQTYRGIRRAVNFCTSLVNRNAQRSTGLASHLLATNARDMPLLHAWHSFQRTKHRSVRFS